MGLSAPSTPLATDTEAKAVTSQALATTPGNLAAVFAEPPALGSTTPAAVSTTMLKAGDGSVTAPTLSFTSEAIGLFRPAATTIGVALSAAERIRIVSASGGARLTILDQLGAGGLCLGNSVSVPDIFLTRDGPGTLAQRNTSNAQEYRLYREYTDASNYSRFSIDSISDTNQFRLIVQNAGTGGGRHLVFGTRNTPRWYIGDSDGHLRGFADNTYDLGASGANRPRTAYLGTNLVVGGAGVIGAASPAATAVLDLTSTTKGFLPPRMTTTERDAISTPAAGLTVYNSTTNKLNFYNGTAWEAVTSA